MKRKKFYCTLPVLFFLFPFYLHAQQAFVSGSVRDSAGSDALVGVVVTDTLGNGAVTDFSGNYVLKVHAGERTLNFHYAGYNDARKTISVSPGETYHLDVLLSSSSKQINIVVVSAGKYEQNIGQVPVSMEVMKPKLIQDKNFSSMDDAIDQVPGVNVTDGQANIRGGSGYSYGAGSRVLLVVDDMPMLSADAADVKWDYLPIENLSQVEVLKGAASALFGSSALNGVIHFRTAYPTDKPVTNITFTDGFYGDPRRAQLKWWGNSPPTFGGMNFFHSRQIGNFDLVVGGHIFNDEGYRYLETTQRARFNINTRYRFKNIPGLSAGINANMMRTSGGLFILWYNDSLPYIPSDSSVQLYKNYRWNVDPFIVYYGPKGHRHALRTRFFRTNNENDKQQGAVADFWYAEYQYQYKFKSDMTITAGAVMSYSNVHSDLYQDHTAANVASYAQFDKQFCKKLFCTVGVRGEYYRVDTAYTQYSSTFFSKDTLKLHFRPVIRAGINYHLFEATWLRVSYGQGYRFPAIAEKFIRTSVSGLEIYPNPVINPETGQSAEFGIKQGLHVGNWKGYADVAAFWMEYHNMIEFTFGQWGNPAVDPFFGLGFKSVNISSPTRTRGIDFSLMGEGKIGGLDVSLLAGYTYMDPQYLAFNPAKDTIVNSSQKNILKYRYRNIAKFDGEVSWKRITFGVSMRYNSFMENIDKIFIAASNIIPGIGAYRAKFNTGDIVFDSRIFYKLNDEVRIGFIVNNMFNREYTSRPADVMPPINFSIQAMIKF